MRGTLVTLTGIFSAILWAAGGSGLAQQAWDIEDYQADRSDGIRILVLHDMEGLSGQDDPISFEFGSALYPLGQELLVGDGNAVIDGLFAGGATEVHVVDGHGSGNPEPDILSDRLDPRAIQLFSDQPIDSYVTPAKAGAYDAVAVVGMHAKTGSGGFASHTYTLGIGLEVNGQSITETELVALSYGQVGIPVIFASGDDRLANDLKTMPWIKYVTVKTATSASTADLRPVDEAHRDLTRSAKAAVEALDEARVMHIAKPFLAGVRVVAPASLALMDGFPGVNYKDGAVSFVAMDFQEAYVSMQTIIGVATRAYASVRWEPIRQLPNFRELAKAGSTSLTTYWLDVESGRRSATEEEPPASSKPRRYHGYN